MPEKKNVWTVLTMLEWATDYFKQKEIPSPRLSIEWLLSHLLGVKRLDLYLKYDRPLSLKELDLLKPMVIRRGKHEPLQYITGRSYFYNITLEVEPGVLIPRQETEQLVELVVQGNKLERKKILDIGTGSGCIPLAIKHECPTADVEAIDISPQALSIAEKNGEKLNLDVLFILSDIADFNPDYSYDIIISNPPYIHPQEMKSLDIEVIEFEPELALIHDDPIGLYKSIIRFAEANLRKNGKLYLEINQSKGKEVLALFHYTHWKVTLLQDYDRNDRFVIAELK